MSRQLPENEHLIELFNKGLTRLEEAGTVDKYWEEFHRGELKKYIKSVKEEPEESLSPIIAEQKEIFVYAKQSIKQKALDVAKQIEIYLEAYPDKTIADLQNDVIR